MRVQKALVVTVPAGGGPSASLDALNGLLRGGWTVAVSQPMGGGPPGAFAQFVVVEEGAADAILGQIEESLAADAPADVQDPLLRRLQNDADDLGPLENRA